MKTTLNLLLTAVALSACAVQPALPDISGDWVIASSVGGGTPVTVYCTLIQQGRELAGTCTPEMANPETSTLAGSMTAITAVWGYDVVFNGNPGRVDFMADSLSSTGIRGTLSLSGTEAPFVATRR